MSLIIRNLQRCVPFNKVILQNNIELLRDIGKIKQYELTVLCVGDKRIQDFNRIYRGLDEITDILVFPFHQCDIPGNLPIATDPELRQLGDMVLGLPYIAEQCLQNNEELEDILPVMITHGLCHLMGYDHETEIQWQQMYNKELEILHQFNKLTGKHCHPLLRTGH